MVIYMGELPIAPIGRIIKNAGAQRVSVDAEQALEKVLEQWAEDVSIQAVKLAKHAGRVTVKASDIELAIEELSPGTKIVVKKKGKISGKSKGVRGKIKGKAKEMEGEIKGKAKGAEGKIKGKFKKL